MFKNKNRRQTTRFIADFLNLKSGFLSLQLPWSVAVAALVVTALSDVLFARCSGSGLRVNLLPTHLVGELAAEGLARRPEGESQLRGHGATQSALAVGSVQHLGGRHDGRMGLRILRVLHAQLEVGIDRQEVLASLR